MKQSNKLLVKYHDRIVGTLAMTAERQAAFAYDPEWLENGFSISPFSLPLREGVFVPKKPYFHGLFGVFADSLPDAWGNLLLDRLLREKGMDRDHITVLDRLAIIGSSGMGALTYEPEYNIVKQFGNLDFDTIASECKKILEREYSEHLDQLYALGGSSGGARPKIMTVIDGECWLIKFPAHVDRPDVGEMEYQYSVCARECGIVMSETKLFPSKKNPGYFGTKRFDREMNEKGEGEKIHMATAAALLELDYEQPSLDYHELMKLTNILTKGNKKDLENMFRRACFNVFAHNRDDHSKNFTFFYQEKERGWRLAPAYDLTYSNTYYGEHTTSVDGNGRNPGAEELKAIGKQSGLPVNKVKAIIQEIQEKTESLKRYH